MGCIEYITNSFHITHVQNLLATQEAYQFVNESWHATLAYVNESWLAKFAYVNGLYRKYQRVILRHTCNTPARNASDRGGGQRAAGWKLVVYVGEQAARLIQRCYLCVCASVRACVCVCDKDKRNSKIGHGW